MQSVFAAFLLFGIAACSRTPARQILNGDSSSYRTTAIPRTLSIGTTINATVRSEVSSGTHSAEETVEAIVTRNVYAANGLVAIPRGSTVLLTISALESARDQGQHAGRVSLRGNEITLESTAYAVIAHIASTPYVLVARVVAKEAPSGPAAAGRYAERDVVVAAGTPIVLTLTQPISVWVR